MNKSTHTLAIEIDTAIQLIVTATRNATLAAVEEAFRGVDRRTSSAAASVGRASPGLEPTVCRKGSRARRSASEISQLAGRLLASLRDDPGKTMAELAQAVDAQPSDLSVPMAQLKQGGRIKSIGRCQFTRYYPRAEAQSGETLDQEAA